jgi:hypothetical protein
MLAHLKLTATPDGKLGADKAQLDLRGLCTAFKAEVPSASGRQSPMLAYCPNWKSLPKMKSQHLQIHLNGMTKIVATFAEQVTSLARTVSMQGKVGAQAQAPIAAGTWIDLTDNINSMASTLTGQVRNIAQVMAVVTKVDFSKESRLTSKVNRSFRLHLHIAHAVSVQK